MPTRRASGDRIRTASLRACPPRGKRLEDPLVAEAPPVGELEARRPFPARLGPKGNLIYKLITTTDHKLIGIMYCVACFVFFFIGGLMALFIRAELGAPGLQFLSNEQYNQLKKNAKHATQIGRAHV